MSDEQAKSVWTLNTTDEQFQIDVIDRSELGLVVVDFWAEWCAPCRALGPVLESLAEAANGKFTLVKANTEQCQRAAGAFGVSGIPAVFSVLGSQVLDTFQGALPAEQIEAWLARQYAVADLQETKANITDQPEAARDTLQAILADAPDHDQAKILLAEAQLALGEVDASRQLIDELESRGFLEPDAERIKAALAVHSMSDRDVQTAQAAVDAEPDNMALKLELAEALIGEQQYEAGLEQCLDLVANDRANTGEQARQVMVEVFQSLPEDSPLIGKYRRKLSMLLY